MARDFSKRFYDSKAWKDLAKLIREKKHFICDKCGRPGATQVHHIIELTPDNSYSTCRAQVQDGLVSLTRMVFGPKAVPFQTSIVFFHQD